MPPKPRPPGHDPERVAALAVAVYRAQLGPKQTASMLAKDDDGGTKLARRAQAYAPIVRDVLDALNAECLTPATTIAQES